MNRINGFDRPEVTKKIQLGRFPIVVDLETFQIKLLRLVRFRRVWPVNEIAFGSVMMAQIIETTIQAFDVDFRRQIVDQQERRSKKNHPAMSILFAVARLAGGKPAQIGHDRKS